MKYLIPSKGRSETVSETVDLLGKKNVKLYVTNEQYDDYVKYVDKSLLNKLPDNTYGMGAIRKHLLNDNRNLDYFFQIDDDTKCFTYLINEKVEQVHDASHIKSIVDNTYQMALDLETPVFGYNPIANPLFFTVLNSMSFNRPVIGGIGVIPKLLGDIDFDPRLLIFEDEDFSLTTKYKKRYYVVDLRYHVLGKKTWSLEGGCSTLRTVKIENECKDILLNKWGNAGKDGGQFLVNCPF
ncbi:hypothetical protein OAU44_00125 [bacterium]|nr:hypothetical protein [bacterium]